MSISRTPPLSANVIPTEPAPNVETLLECFICEETILGSQDCLIIKECSHVFHRHCIETFLATSAECPICKKPCDLADLKKYSFLADFDVNVPLSAPTNTNSTQSHSSGSKASMRGKPRGAKAHNYHTRSYSRSNQDPNSSLIGINNEHLNTPQRQRPQTSSTNNNAPNPGVDHEQINRLIEQNLTRLLSTLNILPTSSQNPLQVPQNPNNVYSNSAHVNSRSRDTFSHIKAVNTSHSNDYSSSNPSTCNFSTDKIGSIIHSWHLQFDGSSNGLNVEEFIYRVHSLTHDNFNGDFTLICKNLNILLSGKAKNWYWRYRKQVSTVDWNSFCTALRSQYRDYKTCFDIREELRNRKQKPTENFDTFYEAISSIVDRLSSPIQESELVEIITRNLLPGIRQDLLYLQIESISHLRKLVQKRENFLNDEHVRRNLLSRNQNIPPLKRQITEIENQGGSSETNDNSFVDAEVDAIKTYSPNIQCWNCGDLGHHWEDCLKDRKIFCYGCGAKEVYKPNCSTCLAKKSLTSKNFRTPVPRVEQ